MKGALIALGLIAIVATFGIMHVRKTNFEIRRELFALESCRKDVHEKLAIIEKAVSNTIAIAEQGDAYVPMGSNLVVELLGESAFPKPVKVQYGAPQRGGAGPAVSPRVSDENPGGLMSKEELDRRRGVSAGGAPAQPPARRADPPPPPVMKPEPVREVNRTTEENPAGLMSREELDRRRAGGGRDPEPKPAEPVRPAVQPPAAVKPAEPVRPLAPPAPVAVAARTKPVGPEEPIMIMFRQLQADLAAIHETAQKASEMGAQARALDEDVMAVKASSNAQEKVVAIAPFVDDSAKLREVALKQLEGIKKRYTDMGKEKVRVEEERRAREEAERKRQAEEAHRTLVASEIQRGAETHRAVLPAIKKFRFKEALDTAKGFQEQMKTPEGRAAVQPGIDLCTRLVAFKQFLIEQMSGESYRWGWGEGASARDIIGANEDGVRHSTGATAWTDISMKQLLKIIDKYVNNEKLGAKVQGEQCLGASLLLRDLEAGEPAELYGRRATQHVPSLEGELTRLK